MRPFSSCARLPLYAAMFAAAVAPAWAQAQAPYPSRAVTLVVPFAPGGATDLTARIVAEGLARKWGQPVIIENKPGAGGNVGSDFVARAAPDGYTLVLGVTGSHGINVSLMKKMPYHPLRDFEPITQATQFPNAIVVHPKVPANNLAEFVALMKKEGSKYSYGSNGTGTGSHLGTEILKKRAGFELMHVPYKGGAQQMADLLGGQIEVGVTGLPAVLDHVRNGKLKMIAVTTEKRFVGAPEYPTVAEQGFPGYVTAPWSGFFAPRGTPKPIVDKLAADMNEVMNDPAARRKMLESGTEFVPSSPTAFRAFVEREIAMWAEAVKVSGAQAD